MTGTKEKELSAHSKQVLKLLKGSTKPLTAYEILGTLHDAGIKAPPTVYRALDALIAHGLVHRIESKNAFIACDSHGDSHGAQFAVCRNCGNVIEIHDHDLSAMIKKAAAKLQFHIEREMLELFGLCSLCQACLPM